jgi:hypothetical protein
MYTRIWLKINKKENKMEARKLVPDSFTDLPQANVDLFVRKPSFPSP